jgi:hypothetical protein
MENNLVSEPKWAQSALINASNNLRIIIDQVDSRFKSNYAAGDFAAASKCQKEVQYHEFIEALRNLGEFWIEWKCDANNLLKNRR